VGGQPYTNRRGDQYFCCKFSQIFFAPQFSEVNVSRDAAQVS
jgi:hypothetical protein